MVSFLIAVDVTEAEVDDRDLARCRAALRCKSWATCAPRGRLDVDSRGRRGLAMAGELNSTLWPVAVSLRRSSATVLVPQ